MIVDFSPMHKRPILKYPDFRLRMTTFPVRKMTESVKTLIIDMIETMYASDGAGVAAIQVGAEERIFVLDQKYIGAKDSPEPLVCINPKITKLSRETATIDEGCLSFPGFVVPVRRSVAVELHFYAPDGQPMGMGADGIAAQAIQHEMDHLNGKLLIDYASKEQREEIRRKLK